MLAFKFEYFTPNRRKLSLHLEKKITLITHWEKAVHPNSEQGFTSFPLMIGMLNISRTFFGVVNPHLHHTSARFCRCAYYIELLSYYIVTNSELLHCYQLCLEKCLLYERLFYLSKLEKSRLSAGFSFRCRRERWLWTHNSVNFINQKTRPYIRCYIFVEWTSAAKVENMSQWSNLNILMVHLQLKGLGNMLH